MEFKTLVIYLKISQKSKIGIQNSFRPILGFRHGGATVLRHWLSRPRRWFASAWPVLVGFSRFLLVLAVSLQKNTLETSVGREITKKTEPTGGGTSRCGGSANPPTRLWFFLRLSCTENNAGLGLRFPAHPPFLLLRFGHRSTQN